MNFDELLQQLGSQISMWLRCLYSTEGMKEAGKRLKCYQHLSSGGRHSILVLFVYSCSSHVLPACYNVLSSVLPLALACPVSSVRGSPDAWSTFSNLCPVLENPSSLATSALVWWCGAVGLCLPCSRLLRQGSQEKSPGYEVIFLYPESISSPR